MKIKIERIGNSWKLIVGDKEFFSSEELDTKELANIIITLAKFEGITAEIDFTTKH